MSSRVSVDRLMQDIDDEVRRARRKRVLARGGAPAFQDPIVYDRVDAALRRAIAATDRDALLLPELLGDDDWRMQTQLPVSSHRPVLGPMVVFIKRKIIFPMTRWIFEYSQDNFKRQQRVNELLFACIEELAIENAALREQMGDAGATGQARAGQTRPDGDERG